MSVERKEQLLYMFIGADNLRYLGFSDRRPEKSILASKG